MQQNNLIWDTAMQLYNRNSRISLSVFYKRIRRVEKYHYYGDFVLLVQCIDFLNMKGRFFSRTSILRALNCTDECSSTVQERHDLLKHLISIQDMYLVD